jgi:hypothetical protein
MQLSVTSFYASCCIGIGCSLVYELLDGLGCLCSWIKCSNIPHKIFHKLTISWGGIQPSPPIRSTKISSKSYLLYSYTSHTSYTMSRAVSRLSNPILRASSSRLAAPSKFLTTSAKKNASDLARLTGRNALLSTPVARVARGASVLGARSASSDEGGSMMVGRVLCCEVFQAKKGGSRAVRGFFGDGGRHCRGHYRGGARGAGTVEAQPPGLWRLAGDGQCMRRLESPWITRSATTIHAIPLETLLTI